jgi:hypothetical protein
MAKKSTLSVPVQVSTLPMMESAEPSKKAVP